MDLYFFLKKIKNIFMNTFLNFTKIPKKSSINEGKISSTCGSNIALIKYWGKYKTQIPFNPSISFTLKKSNTKTQLEFKKSNKFLVKVFLDNKENKIFSTKIKDYFIKIQKILPFITNYSYYIKTHNTFPHSSGIASSASGFGAIAKLLIKMRKFLFPNIKFLDELQEASFLARLGSGSACRSIYKGLVIWGKSNEILGSSNEYAIEYPGEINQVFKSYYDTILLIHEGSKSISSSIGHSLMNDNLYSKLRFKHANKNLKKLIPIIKNGNLNEFNKLIENEAFFLHAMMMISHPSYILMKPNTLACIEIISNFKKQTQIPLGFTLDAGANIHLLYPKKDKDYIHKFIKNELLQYTSNGKCIYDQVDFNEN